MRADYRENLIDILTLLMETSQSLNIILCVVSSTGKSFPPTNACILSGFLSIIKLSKMIKNVRYLAKTGLMLTLKGYYIDLLCIHRIVFCMNKIKTDSPLSDESLKNQSNLYTDLHI